MQRNAYHVGKYLQTIGEGAITVTICGLSGGNSTKRRRKWTWVWRRVPRLLNANEHAYWFQQAESGPARAAPGNYERETGRSEAHLAVRTAATRCRGLSAMRECSTVEAQYVTTQNSLPNRSGHWDALNGHKILKHLCQHTSLFHSVLHLFAAIQTPQATFLRPTMISER
jgi:hypothetical protein